MKQFTDQKIKAWKEHGNCFHCEHEDTKLRKRIVRRGGVQFVHQCQQCGEPASQPIAKAKAFELNGGKEPPEFESSIQRKWSSKRDASAKTINSKFEEQFWADYTEYLKSDEWASKRQKVLKRAEGLCEGCRDNPATEVHHLSYEHVGKEFLFELVAVCNECHERLHPEVSDD